MKNIYKNLETQFNKVFRHLKIGSFKTRERYAKAFKRFFNYGKYLYAYYSTDKNRVGKSLFTVFKFVMR